MSWVEASAGEWLLHSTLGGGAIMLLALGAMRLTRQPARRQRLGEWGMAAALTAAILSLAPAWLVLSVSAPASVPAPKEEIGSTASSLSEPSVGLVPPIALVYVATETDQSEPAVPAISNVVATAPQSSRETLPAVAPSFSWSNFPWLPILGLAYGLGATLILVRWLLGYVALWRLVRSAEPATEAVARLFAAMTGGSDRPRLLVSRRLRVPLSCGLLRPTIVLPPALCEAPDAELRWVFAHELTHLERRDPWTCLLFAFGQVVFFYLPWFWSLRRKVQLCQEYVADASAVAEADQRADYAEFLLSLTTAPSVPAGATGVSGHTSDLFRRIAMLLQNPLAVEKRCPLVWSLASAGGLLAIAVLIAGIGLRADAAVPSANALTLNADDDPVKKDEPKKPQNKKIEGKKEQPKKDDKDEPKKEEKKEKKGIFGSDFELPDIEELLKNLPQNLDPEKLGEIRKQMEQMRGEMRKRIEEARKNMPEGLAGRFGLRAGGMPFASQGRLGVRLERPSAVLADQLDLPKGQGLVVDMVAPDSAAAKAGLKPHDILLQFNGKAVPSSAAEFAEMLREVKADAAVDAVVKRKGKQETIKGFSLPDMKSDPKPRKRPGGIREFVPPAPPSKSDAAFQFDDL